MPDLALEPDEAKALSKAVAEVQRHYPTLKIMSDKHMAVAALGLTVTRVYGKRVAVLAGFPTFAKASVGKQDHPASNGAATPIGAIEPAAEDVASVNWFDTPPPPEGHTH